MRFITEDEVNRAEHDYVHRKIEQQAGAEPEFRITEQHVFHIHARGKQQKACEKNKHDAFCRADVIVEPVNI